MPNSNIETHPLPPFLPKNAKILMLGSFPPKMTRWSMNFFYPNIQNDMWRIMGIIFYNDKSKFVCHRKFDEALVKSFCVEKGIAVSDTAAAVIRLQNNASDKFLQIVENVNLAALLLQIPECYTIVTTGQKATDTILSIIDAQEPKVGGYSEFTFIGKCMKLYRMPSSSRAYPKPIEEKAAIYADMFAGTGILFR
ncbi:MAG: uracil-DNA glycosylase family protein [Cytophagaceae bacterium]|nr:uracil-DNA glycosylase family protein [Cytophagaceae bacterium]